MGEQLELTPEELARQIRALKVSDLVLSTVSTLGQLAYVKLEAKELDQARLAIDAIASLVPTLEGHADPQLLKDFSQLLTNLCLSYASAVSQQAPEAGVSGSEPQTPEEQGSTDQAPRE